MDNSKFLERVEVKLDKIQDDISEIKEIQARNTADIEHHIHRTDLAEQNLELLKEEIKPIKSHVAFVKGAIWALGVAGAILMGLNELGILQKLF